MSGFPPIEQLGRRIIVLGPTNAGKSTLTVALAHRLGIRAVHLDQLRHLPGTDWKQRPDAEFKALHDAAVATDAWIIDGSYSRLMPPRLARSTGLIVLDETLVVRTWRYLRRSLLPQARLGGLAGNRDSIKWEMLAWLWATRHKSHEARQFARGSGRPHVLIHNTRELASLYEAWALDRPRP